MINMGSSTRLTKAEMTIIIIAFLGAPSARMTLLDIMDHAKKGIAIMRLEKYSLAGSKIAPFAPNAVII